MPNTQDKTLEEKRLLARRALEGEERKRAREEEERRKRETEEGGRLEEEAKRKAENEYALQETERAKRQAEKEKQMKREAEEKERLEEEAKREAEEALLKRIRPQTTAPAPAQAPRRASSQQPTAPPHARAPMRPTGIASKEGAANMQTKEARVKKAIPRIRTYKLDAAEAIRKQKKSLAAIAIEEKERKAKKENLGEAEVKEAPRKGAWAKKTIISIVALFAIGGVGWGLYVLDARGVFSDFAAKFTGKPSVEITRETPIEPSLIAAQAQREIIYPDEAGSAVAMFAEELRTASGGGYVKNIFFRERRVIATADEKTIEEAIVSGVDRLLEIWPHTMPDALARSLAAPFMLGVHTDSSGENAPFLILTTNSYAQTLAGMFAWEKNLTDDFAALFGMSAQSGSFRDAIVDGADTRVVRDARGKTILLYAFINNNTVAITTNETTLRKIIADL